ncbi:Na+/proline symporter [Serratia fonticola]|jgi:SSS family solute:Na+ symporter|uniref:Na+/proline symporter n=1 Tax=Serratia fonticola TaxID=47917 RepID=A0A542BU00_SERFO|nr:transporter [Serratia fonticola]TQI82024.1 Na+/proline symporter [Serratia fonticola]TQI95954.1 Na+/proline symporter [Serratia fonticola]TVZ70450.1 Na+/proline symporter [Serratia fonticola]
MNTDMLVVGGYFILMIFISVAFKKMASNSSSDYFRGGGRMLWWMVGATAFMTQFSAWTFTGAAGKAFSDGFAVTFVFLGNIFAYIVSYWWFSQRFRQMRVDTPTEAIERRFGKTNEQFFTWAIIPLSILNGGVWLNGLAIFVGAVFGYDMNTTIWVTGIAVLLISMLSGAWGVVASDFVQTLVVAVISVACAVIALFFVGGPSEIIEKFPGDFIMGPDMNYGVLLIGSFLFFLVKQLQSINNMQDSYRFLNAKDSNNARKAALLAMVLMLFGTLIWFVPPWAMAILEPNAAAAHAELGNKAGDAVYLVFAEKYMPLGTVGLLVAGLFAATMSSMDSALCRNSGIFVRSFWTPIVCRNKPMSEIKTLRLSQGVTLVNGILVILIAQLFAQLKGLSLFELMMRVSTLLQSPILVPLFFGMFIRKTPKWAAWSTVCFGMFVSWLVMDVFTAKWFASLFNVTLTSRELSELTTTITVAAHLVLTGGFFCATSLFYKEKSFSKEELQRVDNFFVDVETPVIADDDQDAFDRLQRSKLGHITLMMGGGLLLMALLPNPWWGRLLFVACSGVILLIGYLLKRSAGDAERRSALQH